MEEDGRLGGTKLPCVFILKCLAFHRAISSCKGTKDCARRAIELGIPTYSVCSEAVEPKLMVAGEARLR